MTIFSELLNCLRAMGWEHYLLAFVFLSSYSLALGGLIGVRGRVRAAVIAPVSAAAFAALTNPWTYGVILSAVGVLAMGVFVALAWTLGRLFSPQEAEESALESTPSETGGIAGTPPDRSRAQELRSV